MRPRPRRRRHRYPRCRQYRLRPCRTARWGPLGPSQPRQELGRCRHRCPMRHRFRPGRCRLLPLDRCRSRPRRCRCRRRPCRCQSCLRFRLRLGLRPRFRQVGTRLGCRASRHRRRLGPSCRPSRPCRCPTARCSRMGTGPTRWCPPTILGSRIHRSLPRCQ